MTVELKKRGNEEIITSAIHHLAHANVLLDSVSFPVAPDSLAFTLHGLSKMCTAQALIEADRLLDIVSKDSKKGENNE